MNAVEVKDKVDVSDKKMPKKNVSTTLLIAV